MYLENSEQTSEACEEGQSSAEAMLAEQCQVPKLSEVADLASPSKGSTQLAVKVLMEYTEQTVVSREMLQHGNSSGECTEHCNMKRDNDDETEHCVYCNGHAEGLEQYPTSDAFLKSGHDECETAGLSQPSDECGQHCECFKPCKSSEHCANHSLASKCSPCCEHCPEHLHLFQQCKLSNQQSVESEPENLTENCEKFGQSEMSSIIPECTDHLDSPQQYEFTDQHVELNRFDGEPCDTTDFNSSMDSLDCDTELCENYNIHSHIECIDGDNDSCLLEQTGESCEMQDSDGGLSEDISPSTITSFCVEDNEQLTKENFEQGSELDASTDPCEIENDNFEVSQETEVCVTSEQSSEDKATDCSTFSNEEDGSSDCSSVETKSFKTCLEGSIPSEPYSDSSEESEKGGQEDSSDEQSQWESFEEDEEIIQQTNTLEGNCDEKKTPTLDIVIGDYFDLFDRADYFGHVQRRPYISCFDGGDIHDRLSLEELQAEQQKYGRNAYKYDKSSKDVSAQDVCIAEEFSEKDTSDEDTTETSDTSFGSSETEKQPEDDIKSESDLVDDEIELNDSASEVCEAEEEDGQSYVSDELNEDAADEETCPHSSGPEESMCAPCAEDIYVEGDAYEDDVFDNMDDEWHNDSISTTEHLLKTDGTDAEEPDIQALSNFYTFEDIFIACSETEPYWDLGNNEEVICESDIEDYYAYQIKSIQSSPHQSLNVFLVKPQRICPEVSKGVRFGITEVVELGETLSHCSTDQDSDSESSLDNVSRETRPPLGIIHSVVSENDKIDSRTEDSEEEASDDESPEPCECEYCIPPQEQVPAKALLPQVQLNDAGKICVVIDLDETLVHSSFKPLSNADFTIPVEIDGTSYQVYVLKRPHVDEFLKRMGELFECVLFTASLSKYADPVSDLLDTWGAFTTRLFRESCVFHKGNYVKDLSRLGRNLNRVIIIDNSPASYIFHPDNAVPVASWFDDMSDTELLDLLPFFERLSKVDDIYTLLQQQQSMSS